MGRCSWSQWLFVAFSLWRNHTHVPRKALLEAAATWVHGNSRKTTQRQPGPRAPPATASRGAFPGQQHTPRVSQPPMLYHIFHKAPVLHHIFHKAHMLYHTFHKAPALYHIFHKAHTCPDFSLPLRFLHLSNIHPQSVKYLVFYLET